MVSIAYSIAPTAHFKVVQFGSLLLDVCSRLCAHILSDCDGEPARSQQRRKYNILSQASLL